MPASHYCKLRIQIYYTFVDCEQSLFFSDLVTGVQARASVEGLPARNEGGWLLQSRIWSFACLTRIARWTKKKERLLVVYTFAKRNLKNFVAYDFIKTTIGHA